MQSIPRDRTQGARSHQWWELEQFAQYQQLQQNAGAENSGAAMPMNGMQMNLGNPGVPPQNYGAYPHQMMYAYATNPQAIPPAGQLPSPSPSAAPVAQRPVPSTSAERDQAPPPQSMSDVKTENMLVLTLVSQ